jgi:hypothetical protein
LQAQSYPPPPPLRQSTPPPPFIQPPPKPEQLRSTSTLPLPPTHPPPPQLSAILALFGLLFIVVLAKRINLAVRVIQQAARAIVAIPLVLLFPITTWVAIVALTIYWVFVFVYLDPPPLPSSPLGYAWPTMGAKLVSLFSLSFVPKGKRHPPPPPP